MRRKEQGRALGRGEGPRCSRTEAGPGVYGAMATGDKGGEGGGRALTILWSLEGVHKAISCSCWQVVFTEICLAVKKMTTNLSWDNWACTEGARHGQGSEGPLAESCSHGHFLGDSSDGRFSFLTGKTTGIPIHVFGTETHMTAIVGMALGHRPIPNQPPTAAHTANFLLNASGSTSVGASLPLLQSLQSSLSPLIPHPIRGPVPTFWGPWGGTGRRLCVVSFCISAGLFPDLVKVVVWNDRGFLNQTQVQILWREGPRQLTTKNLSLLVYSLGTLLIPISEDY